MSIKSAAILTSEESFLNNYGAALQGYALYSVLKENKIDPCVVRYRGGEVQNTLLQHVKFKIRRTIWKGYHRIIDTPKINLTSKDKKRIREREAMFSLFSEEYMSFWNKKRVSWWQLQKKYPKCDYYICGSDQIWNPYFKCGYNDPGYFLAFAPKKAIKIAYAASFGCDDIPNTAKETLPDLLKDFHAISVREESGIEIVHKYANRTAEHVLDPTLLKTDKQWRQLAKMPEGLPEHYILTYRFAESDNTKCMIDQVAKATGWPVVSLPLSLVAMQDDYYSVFEAGPQEFIGLIDNASLVCTDSFHATVFSIILKTPVCVFLRESYNNGNSMNSRIYSLLSMLHLEKHILNPDAQLDDAMNCINEDYEEALDLLGKERKKSIAFLKEALQVN